MNSKRYSDKRKFGFEEHQNEEMPAEHLRKIVKVRYRVINFRTMVI